MNKVRVETLSDGVFAIVMTLLIFDIKVPEYSTFSDSNLWYELVNLFPLFAGYAVSMAVLAMYWMGHHFLFYYFSKTVNRTLAYLNMVFLGFLALVPFSAKLLGVYNQNQVAIFIYGLNIICLGYMLYIMFSYALSSKEIETEKVPRRLIKQASIRILLPPIFATAAIVVSFVSIPWSLTLFALPIIFNVIPGSLYFVERLIGYEIE